MRKGYFYAEILFVIFTRPPANKSERAIFMPISSFCNYEKFDKISTSFSEMNENRKMNNN